MAIDTCRHCGCDDLHACETDDGACYWHRPGYCSGCAEKHLEQLVSATDHVRSDCTKMLGGFPVGIEVTERGNTFVTDHLGLVIFGIAADGVYLAPHYDALELLPLFEARAA